MSEMETLKVYELAKELGIDSISLLDKLKSLNINVKNHMSELGGEEVRTARTALRKPAEGEKSPAARKKAAATLAGRFGTCAHGESTSLESTATCFAWRPTCPRPVARPARCW